jgi:hypothetical protein
MAPWPRITRISGRAVAPDLRAAGVFLRAARTRCNVKVPPGLPTLDINLLLVSAIVASTTRNFAYYVTIPKWGGSIWDIDYWYSYWFRLLFSCFLSLVQLRSFHQHLTRNEISDGDYLAMAGIDGEVRCLKRNPDRTEFCCCLVSRISVCSLFLCLAWENWQAFHLQFRLNSDIAPKRYLHCIGGWINIH